MDEIKRFLKKCRQWCGKNRKIAVLLSAGIVLLLGFLFVGELFFDGGDSFRDDGFERDFGGHGDGEDSAVYAPLTAAYNLSLIGGTAFIIGLLLYVLIFRKKNRIQPLPVLFNPNNPQEKENVK